MATGVPTDGAIQLVGFMHNESAAVHTWADRRSRRADLLLSHGSYFCCRCSKFSVLNQNIEDVRTFAGQQITVSFWAKADAAKPIAVEFIQKFGFGGSPSSE
jgi:hypothetical protein